MASAPALMWVTCPTAAQGQSLLIVPQISVFSSFWIYSYIPFPTCSCNWIVSKQCQILEVICAISGKVALPPPQSPWPDGNDDDVLGQRSVYFFSAKSTSINILAFEGHRVSLAITDTPRLTVELCSKKHIVSWKYFQLKMHLCN